MGVLGKYRVIDGGDSETYKYHRRLLEQALQEHALSDRARAALKRKLQLTLEGEIAAKQREDNEAADSRRKESGDKSSGESAAGAIGNTGMVSRADSITYDDQTDEQQDNAMDMLVLFLLMGEEVAAARPQPDPLPVAVIIDPHDQTAYLYEDETKPENVHQHLAALEHHAVSAGAKALQLKVASDAVDMYRKKFGYEPVGKAVDLKGKALQRMKKTFSRAQLLSYTPPQG